MWFCDDVQLWQASMTNSNCFRGIEHAIVSVDEEIVREAIEVCETAIESTQECLASHDERLGRTTRKNKAIAVRHEQEIDQAKRCRSRLRKVMGWPEI
jgi:tRNA-dihydrouridine synthase